MRSLEPQVRLEPVAAALAAEAGLLVAAERRRRVEPVERVPPDDAGAQPVGHPEDPRALLGPDPRREPVHRVVRLLDGLVRRAEREHAEDGPEDLLARDAVALGDVREDRRREPPALLGEPARRLVDLRALLVAARDELVDPVELRLRVDRADVGVLVERVADAQRRHPALQLAHELVVDRLLDEEPRAGAADVALVEVDAVDDPLDRLVERRVLEDDVGGLAAELEREGDPAPGQLALDRLPDLGRPRERDLVDRRGCGRGAAPVAPSPVTMFTTPGGTCACRQTSAKSSAVSGVVSAGLSTTVLPHASAGAIFHASIRSGKFQGTICAATPSGRGRRSGNAYSSLSAQPGVVEEVRRGERQVDVARLLDRLAAVERLGHRELARSLLEDARDPEEHLGALGGLPGAPRLEGLAGGVDRELDVLRPGLRDLGERLLRRRARRS